MTRRTVCGALSVAGLAVGSLGPWLTFGPFSASGTNGDGVLTLLAAVAIGLLMATKRLPLVVVFLGVVALAIGIYDTTQVSNSGNEIFSASVGWGLLLVDLAAASLVAYAVLARRRLRTAVPA